MRKPFRVDPADPAPRNAGSRHHTLPQLGRSSDAIQRPNHGREIGVEGCAPHPRRPSANGAARRRRAEAVEPLVPFPSAEDGPPRRDPTTALSRRLAHRQEPVLRAIDGYRR